jgi:hypothetical protein
LQPVVSTGVSVHEGCSPPELSFCAPELDVLLLVLLLAALFVGAPVEPATLVRCTGAGALVSLQATSTM